MYISSKIKGLNDRGVRTSANTLFWEKNNILKHRCPTKSLFHEPISKTSVFPYIFRKGAGEDSGDGIISPKHPSSISKHPGTTYPVRAHPSLYIHVYIHIYMYIYIRVAAFIGG